MHVRRLIGVLGLVSILAVGSACGKIAEKASNKVAEKATEKAIEQGSGAKVDIDPKTGKVKVKAKDGSGSFETDGEGNVKVTGKDGDSTYSAGKGAKIPAGWPSNVKLPSGLKVISSSTSKVEGGSQLMVTGTLKGDAEKIFDTMLASLKGAGFEIDENNATQMENGFSGSASAADSKNKVVILISESESGITFTAQSGPVND